MSQRSGSGPHVAQRLGQTPNVADRPGDAEQGWDRRSFLRGRCEPGGEEDRLAGGGLGAGVVAGFRQRFVDRDARQARCAQRGCEARSRRAEERGVGAGRAAACAACSNKRALLRLRVHRAAAEVVVAAGDQHHRAGRVQRQPRRGLRGRRGQGVADDLAAVDAAEALAPQRQARPARERLAIAFGRGSREQRAGGGQQARLRGPGAGGRAALGPRSWTAAGEPDDQPPGLDARARVARRGRAACSAASRAGDAAASSTAPGSSALTTVQSSAAWNATMRRLASR